MYESKRQPLAPTRLFFKRVGKNLLITALLTIFALLIGTMGYHYWGNCQWIDAFHNACMILSGMGPVVTIDSVNGKLFSSFYALFSGLAFVANVGFLLAPVLHRVMHSLHLQE